VRRRVGCVARGLAEPDLAAWAVPHHINGAGELLGAADGIWPSFRALRETVQEYPVPNALLESSEALAPRLPLRDRFHAATADQPEARNAANRSLRTAFRSPSTSNDAVLRWSMAPSISTPSIRNSCCWEITEEIFFRGLSTMQISTSANCHGRTNSGKTAH